MKNTRFLVFTCFSGLNFLKTVCNKCVSREKLVKRLIEIWREKTYAPGSKIYFEAKAEFEKMVEQGYK